MCTKLGGNSRLGSHNNHVDTHQQCKLLTPVLSLSFASDKSTQVAFAYALYRVKANHRLTVPQDTFPPPPYPTSRHRADGFDDDGFQIIELK